MERKENYLDSQNNTLSFDVSEFWRRKQTALQYISPNPITKSAVIRVTSHTSLA